MTTSKPTEGEVPPAGCAGVVCANETTKKKIGGRKQDIDTLKQSGLKVAESDLPPEMKFLHQRYGNVPDIKPVYSFNAGGLWQAKNKGSVRVGTNNLRSWKDLMSRI